MNGGDSTAGHVADLKIPPKRGKSVVEFADYSDSVD